MVITNEEKTGLTVFVNKAEERAKDECDCI